MKYWLTTHYPDDNADWFIYVPRGFEGIASQFEEGDRVAIYEVQTGKDRVGKAKKRPSGRQGIICLATGTQKSRPSKFNEKYTDNTETEFVLECPCSKTEFGHCLKRDEVCEVLGFSEKYNFHGFANGAGFALIAPEAFSEIESRFLHSSAD